MQIQINISKENKEKTLRLISELVDLEEDGKMQNKEPVTELEEKTVKQRPWLKSKTYRESYDDSTNHKPRLLQIGDKEYSVKNWRDVLTDTVMYLLDTKRLSVRDCPVPATDRRPYKRNLVNKKPEHNDGSLFRLPIPVEGLYVETHWSASRTCLLSEWLLKKFGNGETLRASNKTQGLLYSSAA
ncbi:MAG: hypothetical protein KGI04_00600 [Candidatus Micrarchaeota archaeon]|nr:hypothetical protein [Candidatus Micrarchaeota archaeon]